MGRNRGRTWYKAGTANPIMILVDYQLCAIIASIEQVSQPSETPAFLPNQDEAIYKFIALAFKEKREFAFNPHDTESANDAAEQATKWCNAVVGPPVYVVSVFGMAARAFMFWRWKIIWKNGFPAGLARRGLKEDDYELEDYYG